MSSTPEVLLDRVETLAVALLKYADSLEKDGDIYHSDHFRQYAAEFSDARLRTAAVKKFAAWAQHYKGLADEPPCNYIQDAWMRIVEELRTLSASALENSGT